MSARSDRAQRIGDELVAFLTEHELEKHGGERCRDEAVNMIAYLCHRIGLGFADDPNDDTLAEFRALVERATDYDAVHAEHS